MKVGSKGTLVFRVVKSPSGGPIPQPNEHQLVVNSIPAWPRFSFRWDNWLHQLWDQDRPTATDFPTTVQVPLNQIGLLDSLTVTVDISDSNDAMLGLKLIAPDGESITLFTNQTIGGGTVQVRGISGGNVGENNGFLVGTTFTDNAARSIVDISADWWTRSLGPIYRRLTESKTISS